MEYLHLVKLFQTANGSQCDLPNLFLLELLLRLLVLGNFLEEVAIVSEIHNYAEICFIVEKRMFVANYRWMGDRS